MSTSDFTNFVIRVGFRKLVTRPKIKKLKFTEENRELVIELINIALLLNQNETLRKKINDKYLIKNTMGYGVNALIDFKDPIEIIKHLMIGSEGTLGFISELTLNTVDSFSYKGTSLIIFPNVKMACAGIPILNGHPNDSAELMDMSPIHI